MFAPSKRAAFGAFGAVLALPAVGALFATPAPADPAPPAPAPLDQCVSHVLTPEQRAAGDQVTLSCFRTFAEAMASLGVSVPSSANAANVGLSAVQALSVLAIHYENRDGTGAAWVVWGGDCSGYVNVPGPYLNMFSATRHGICSRIKHYTGFDLTGSGVYTVGGQDSLQPYPASINDNVASIKYAP